MNNWIDKLSALAVVLLITTCIMHPSLWIGAAGTLIHIAIVLLLAKVVCRVVFKKSIKELLFDEKEEK